MLVIGLIIGLITDYFVASSFRNIAEMKGHDGRVYFWWTFCLAFFGMMMVIALPDRNQTVSLSDESVQKIVKGVSRSAASAPAPVFAPQSDELPSL